MVPAWIFYLLPVLSAFIGWIIAKIAVSVYISALLKRKENLGKAIGNYAAAQFSFDPIEKKLTSAESIENILPFADEHIENFLRVKLPAAMPMLAMFISDKLVADMKAIFMKELTVLFPALIQQYLSGIKKDVDVSKLVSERVFAVSDALITPFLKKALRVVDYTCVLTGFLCGSLYTLLTLIA